MTITETPLSSLVCNWCESGVSASNKICPSCSMPISMVSSERTTADNHQPVARIVSTPRKKATPKVIKETAPADIRPPLVRINESIAAGNTIVIGIDPGSRFVGFCVRDNKDNIFISSTFYRPDEVDDFVDWSKKVVARVREELKDIEYHIMGIETVTEPKGFKYGKQDALNPKDIIRTALVVGALAVSFPDAFMVRPRGNGDKAVEEYPACLSGPRPSTLGGVKDPGVTVRKHERSAYDVAEHALFEYVQRKSH